MYSREGAYFGSKKVGFINSTWIELIGFDRTSPDYSVKDYIKTLGFVPDCVSFHLTSVDFVNTHGGMDTEYTLPQYACSYFGHTHNDDRERQPWTNYDLKGLVDELHFHGIKAYASFFDLEADSGIATLPKFCDSHPELRVVDKKGNAMPFISMIKRFKDGSYYEDYLMKGFLSVIKDYSLDGLQLADGISCPRVSLQEADFSDDVIEQFLEFYNMTLPEDICVECIKEEEFEARSNWILDNHKDIWIKFNTARWSAFMTKIIKAIRSEGKDAAFNSAWTKDPLEAIYRYGADYKAYVRAGATSCIVEDVSSDLALLTKEDNGYHMDYDRRKFVHHEFAATLMANKAHMSDTMITPLFMIRDTLEQWDVLHHMPTAMQRAAATNLNNYIVRKGRQPEPVTNGPHFCLADGLTPDEWNLVRAVWDNGYTEPYSIPGFTVLWSEKRMYGEIDELLKNRRWHTTKWISELASHGAPVHKISNIKDIDAVTGPLLVTNPDLLAEEELQTVLAYKCGSLFMLGGQIETKLESKFKIAMKNGWGEVYFTGFGETGEFENAEFENDHCPPENIQTMREPVGGVWTHPLVFADVDKNFVKRCVQIMIETTNYPTLYDDYGACNVVAINTGIDTMRIFVENEEYYYALPWIETGKEIIEIEAITKPKGYPIRLDGSKFKLRVPGRGMDVIEIKYKD